jgi:hypothetical protein
MHLRSCAFVLFLAATTGCRSPVSQRAGETSASAAPEADWVGLLFAAGDGGWRATCWLPPDGGLPAGSRCSADNERCHFRSSSTSCVWNEHLGQLIERSANSDSGMQVTETWALNGVRTAVEVFTARERVVRDTWFPTGQLATSWRPDGGIRGYRADGCFAGVSHLAPFTERDFEVIQTDFPEVGCDAGTTGPTRLLTLPHGISRLSTVNHVSFPTRVAGPDGSFLNVWPGRLCIEDECLHFPKGTLAGQGSVFWHRSGRWALARLAVRRSATGASPHFDDPPNVLVDLKKRRLKSGAFPLGRDLSGEHLAQTPCSPSQLAVEIGTADWLCFDSTPVQASRHRVDGGVERCVSSRTHALLNEGVLFELQPEAFAWDQTAACETVFEGVSVRVPGTEQEWQL